MFSLALLGRDLNFERKVNQSNHSIVLPNLTHGRKSDFGVLHGSFEKLYSNFIPIFST